MSTKENRKALVHYIVKNSNILTLQNLITISPLNIIILECVKIPYKLILASDLHWDYYSRSKNFFVFHGSILSLIVFSKN